MEITAPPAPQLLLVVCEKRHTQTIIQEFESWNVTEQLGVKVLLYGITPKAHEGFLLLELTKPLPEAVYLNMSVDDDIVDYVLYTPPPSHPIVSVVVSS